MLCPSDIYCKRFTVNALGNDAVSRTSFGLNWENHFSVSSAIGYQSTLSPQTAAVQKRSEQLLSMSHWFLKARSPSSGHCEALQLILRPCHKTQNGGGSITNASLPGPLSNFLQKSNFCQKVFCLEELTIVLLFCS